MAEITLSRIQINLIEALKNFMKSNHINLFLQQLGYCGGLHFALLIFVRYLHENVIIYTYTQRQASQLFNDFLQLIPNVKIIMKNMNSIEYIDNSNIKRYIEFSCYKTRSSGINALYIYTQLLYDEVKFDSNRFVTKTIWFINSEIDNEVIKKHNGLLLFLNQ